MHIDKLKKDTFKQADKKIENEQGLIDELSASANEFSALMKDFAQFQSQVQKWSTSTIELFWLELKSTFAGLKQLLLCHVLLLCLSLFFIISVCVGMGVVTYVLTANVLLSYAAFMGALSMVLIALIVWQKHVLQFMGFSNTLAQIKEGVDVFTQQAKKSN